MKRDLWRTILALACLLGGGDGRLRADAAVPSSGRLVPLYVEVWAKVHGSALGPFEPDMALRTRDRFSFQVWASSAAHVYLLHCDAAGLSVFPNAGDALRLDADQRLQLPAAGQQVRLSPLVGSEAFYVVASKRPLAQADPALLAHLTGDPAHGCGAELEAKLAGTEPRPSKSEAPPHRFLLRGIETSGTTGSAARGFSEDDGVVAMRFAFQHLP